MFGKSLNLFKIFGFQIKVDVSWLIIAVLVTWSLAVGFFPHFIEDLSPMGYWILGVIGALGLFFSILFHEFWHSWVARNYGVPIRGITLFIFGGVAEMEDDPQSPKSEFWIAIAGPLASIFLALVFFVLYNAAQFMGLGAAGIILFMYLALINTILAVFNMIPAFPMDGGRILRAVLWKWKGDQRWATRIAANMGSMFGLVLIGIGILNMLTGNVVGGLWYFVIGIFIRYVAQNAYRQMMIKSAVAGARVRSLMKRPVYVSPDITLARLVEEYVYQFHFKMFPVVDQGKLLGCITTRQIGSIDRHQWGDTLVRHVYIPCSDNNTIHPNTDILYALNRMNQEGQSRMMVVDNGILMGMISLKDIMGYLSARMEIEGDRSFSD
ncbi:site-2 protease family protein [Desulfonatronospira sp. MSAO_Bac3]|uniref:site-2 protease family protein n=1 Tax=Desulfonatronospira sp. MSAO_Bac3 TaxID=2293857 RepID=UPI000FF13B60|nr:site-2 protease family protein [Desulfonatronospira sp. MSAO_Bac3]RQD76691.1 MAG: site-2 protease family protein [Desulfonatronospira sp. MSAO_Bac3]